MNICKESLILENKSIYLRPLQIEDITDEYVNGLNDPDVNEYLVNVRLNVQTFKSVEKYVKSNMENPLAILFGIFIKHDDKPLIGTVYVSGIDFFHFLASVGVCLFAKRAWRKGYGFLALGMAKDYLFKQQELHYIEAGVYAENMQSIKLFKRVGFSEKYRVEDKYRYSNSFKEVIIFGLINHSFDISNLEQKRDNLS